MKRITRKERYEPEGYVYRKKSDYGCGDCVVEVDAEIAGHGCLYGMKLPEFCVVGMCWSGDQSKPEMRDVLAVLNQVFKDFNCGERIVTGSIKEV